MPALPQTTDPHLLAAIPHMQPWADASKDNCWVLREPGRQLLVYSSGKLDLSGETGTFKARVVNEQTGSVASEFQTIQAGGIETLPLGVVWLTRD
jgi:hypothetical protein